MRFLFAIVALVLAGVMIVLGIAQRTVFLEPATSSLSATIAADAPYAVIDSSALTEHPGAQTVTLSGSDTLFAAYGRTADVKAWLAGHDYVSIHSTDKNGPGLGSDTVPADTDVPAGTAPVAAATVTNPAGSDLWLEEFTGTKELTATVNLPEGISMIVASDGTNPAPSTVSITWPVDNSTPWAGPLIMGGAILALVGLILYLWALLHLRRSHGPRRNLPKGPRMPRLPRAPRPKSIKASEITGRRSIGRSLIAVVPMFLVSGLVLTGCSAEFWPGSTPTDAASLSPTPDASGAAVVIKDVPPAAVTVPQLERIMTKISAVAADGDKNLSADILATRFTGPAFDQRLANYKVRAIAPDFPALAALPAGPLTLSLPQQSATWPRVVMTVVQNKDTPDVAPTVVVLRQESARASYLVEYAVQLEPSAKIPDLAPATIGAPIIAPDSKLMLLPPDQVAAAYADILSNGEASPSLALFDATGDSFRTQIDANKADKKAKLPTTASIEFGAKASTGPTIALATNDSGSIVAVSIEETETVKPVDAAATVSPGEGAVASKALSGLTATAKGFKNTYADQLLFHVPAAGSSDKIVLLGFAQGLISSTELP
ncbi:hypothetical protein [Cryobacterium glucosi]|uniref:DUF8094 domain-containing protein n=2 Tax=Bacteria TaxID=2 RepID=A0ABY2IU36_9MICO|nr:hypothetical protein [Cryobacterium glucosi]TFC23700.1 hypothetical protein E3O46_01320 [Cryobacterium glucosi]